MATPQMTLRVDLVTRERWEAAARGRGMPLARFIRECVEAELGAAGLGLDRGGGAARAVEASASPDMFPGGVADGSVAPSSEPALGGPAGEAGTRVIPVLEPRDSRGVAGAEASDKPAARRARVSVCPHRLRPDQFCARCDG